jgi:two-component system, NarL family, nitrate/nitrite response regulator NarL
LRVVLADDHQVVLSGLKALLGLRPGTEVVAAVRNGAEAWTALQQLEPDIAVLDINMPELTGVEVLEKVEAEGLSTRVILLAASPSDAQITTAVGRGAWGIMLKDDSASDTLLQCLEGVLAGERWLPSELVDRAFVREAERQQNWESFEKLTQREREVALLVAQGLSNKHIARQTQLSLGTVKIHLHNSYHKLGVSNRTGLATLTQNYLRSRDQAGS